MASICGGIRAMSIRITTGCPYLIRVLKLPESGTVWGVVQHYPFSKSTCPDFSLAYSTSRPYSANLDFDSIASFLHYHICLVLEGFLLHQPSLPTPEIQVSTRVDLSTNECSPYFFNVLYGKNLCKNSTDYSFRLYSGIK